MENSVDSLVVLIGHEGEDWVKHEKDAEVWEIQGSSLGDTGLHGGLSKELDVKDIIVIVTRAYLVSGSVVALLMLMVRS